MEKSFEDLLTGLDSDGEPDIDDIINNCDLPEVNLNSVGDWLLLQLQYGMMLLIGGIIRANELSSNFSFF